MEDNSSQVALNMLTELLGYKLRLVHLFSIEKFREISSRIGITTGQAGALILVANNPGISQADLARAMHIERATMGTTVSRMISRDWLVRRANKGNRRAYALYLSDEGKALVDQLIPLLRDHEKRITENLSSEEATALKLLLEKIPS